MKIPEVPDWRPTNAEQVERIITSEAFRAEIGGRYLHWDELRHRDPPAGLTVQEWWWGTRMARRQLGRDLPLTNGVSGNAFTFAMTDTAQRLVHEIDRDASGRVELPEDISSPAVRDRYIFSSLIEEAFRSSQLEGASTTRLVAKEMIRTKRDPRNKSEHMILNNYVAMEWVRESKDQPLSIDRLFELQSIVTRNTLDVDDGAGRFRRVDEDVRVIDNTTGDVVHTPPAAGALPGRIQRLCDFANGTSADEPFIHPVVRAIIIHFWLAYDHPFVDGNGRTARALFYWSMLRQGYWLTEFLSISRVIHKSRAGYERAFIYSETDRDDATYFLFHQLKVLRTAIDELHGYIKRKAKEMRELEVRLRGRDDLNNRQLVVLNDALRHPEQRITIEGHQLQSRVVYQTARTDLLGLVEMGYLEQTKIGKKLYFTPVRDLDRRLEPQR